MPAITTAEEAIDTGANLIRKYYTFLRPMTVRKEDQTWLVVFDVGALKVQRIEVRIDAETGSITEFDGISES